MILLGRTILAVFALATLAACEKQQEKTTTQLSKQSASPGTLAPDSTMQNPSAIIVAWVGPSDRPSPPIVLWADAAALKSSSDWLSKRGLAPIGVTSIESKADALACVGKSIPVQASGRNLVEVTAWRDGTAPAPIVMDGPAAITFLDGAVGCVSENAAGYLKSIMTLVKNAGG